MKKKTEDIVKYRRDYHETHREELKDKRKVYRKLHPDPKKVEYNRKYARNVRLEVIYNYSGGFCVCECCGENTLEFLCIDHINGGGTKHRKEHKGENIYMKLRSQGYPEGYRVLCHNCNMAIGFYGCCPHEKQKHDII